MSEWKVFKLGDICEILDYKRVPLSSMQRKQRKGVFPYYGAQGIIDYVDEFLFEGTYLLVAEDGNNVLAQKENIANLASGKFWVNNHAHVLGYNGKCDLKLLEYILNHKDISSYVTGTAQPKLNQANLLKIPIELPSFETQQKIVTFLKSLDDKIENNQKINENLEQQAQALFKSWFIDFEPFKDIKFIDSELGPIPEGWRVGTLDEIATITMGQSPSGESLNDNKDGIIFYQGRTEFGFRYPSIRLYTTEPSRYAEPNSVLLSVRAPVGDINRALIKCCIGRGLASIRSLFGNDSFLYYLMLSQRTSLDIYNGEGTVFGSINRNALEGLKIIIPPHKIIDKFDEIVVGIDSAIKSHFLENERLSILRDTLLPKLMSGEIEV